MLTIRTIRSTDVRSVREIDRLSFASDDQYDDALYDDATRDDRLRAFVAEIDGRVVAWALADVIAATVRVRSLSTHPEFRRNGCARALLFELERYAQSRPLDLLVDASNAGAIALYVSLGFALTDPDPEVPQKLRMIRYAQ